MARSKLRVDTDVYSSLFENPDIEIIVSASRPVVNTSNKGQIMNYKNALKSIPKKDLIDMMPVTPEMVEKCEIELAGGVHSNEINGPDGSHCEHGCLEVKTQRYRGKYKLFGRAKFGGISIENHARKLKENELVIVTGYNEQSGEVYYRFKFRFVAIADRYLDAVQKSATKGWSNYDAIPLHYMDHPTFEIDYVADRNILGRDKHVFQPKFLKLLLSY